MMRASFSEALATALLPATSAAFAAQMPAPQAASNACQATAGLHSGIFRFPADPDAADPVEPSYGQSETRLPLLPKIA
jgi:hypothetical protein